MKKVKLFFRAELAAPEKSAKNSKICADISKKQDTKLFLVMYLRPTKF